MYIYIYIYVYIYIYILDDCSRGDPKASFSIATKPRCRGGYYSFPWFLPFAVDPNLIILSVKHMCVCVCVCVCVLFQ